MDIQKIKLLPLLRLAECEICTSSYKKKGRIGLFCGWGETTDEKDVRCTKVKDCGHWPTFMY